MLSGPSIDPLEGRGPKRIIDRESEYHRSGRMRRTALSPQRDDPFKVPDSRDVAPAGSKAAEKETGVKRGFKDAMEE